MSLLPFSPTFLSGESHEYRARWCLLRAIEWRHWPLFLGQLAAPIALIFFPWEQVAFALLAISLVWSLICLNMVNLHLAHLGALLVHLKWLISIGAAIYLAFNAEYTIAAVALLWPFVTLLFIWLVPSVTIGAAEAIFIKKVLAMPSDA